LNRHLGLLSCNNSYSRKLTMKIHYIGLLALFATASWAACPDEKVNSSGCPADVLSCGTTGEPGEICPESGAQASPGGDPIISNGPFSCTGENGEASRCVNGSGSAKCYKLCDCDSTSTNPCYCDSWTWTYHSPIKTTTECE